MPGKFHGQRSLAGYSPWVAKSWTWLSPPTIEHREFYSVLCGNQNGKEIQKGGYMYTNADSLCYTAAAAKSLQSCPSLCDPIDGSPPGSPVPGILQARTLEWIAISFSNAWKWKVKGRSLSCVQLFATPWTAAYQAPPSMGFSRQEHWNGVPSPSPAIPLNTGFKVAVIGSGHQVAEFHFPPNW